jgi:hypothetical protein
MSEKILTRTMIRNSSEIRARLRRNHEFFVNPTAFERTSPHIDSLDSDIRQRHKSAWSKLSRRPLAWGQWLLAAHKLPQRRAWLYRIWGKFSLRPFTDKR